MGYASSGCIIGIGVPINPARYIRVSCVPRGEKKLVRDPQAYRVLSPIAATEAENRYSRQAVGVSGAEHRAFEFEILPPSQWAGPRLCAVIGAARCASYPACRLYGNEAQHCEMDVELTKLVQEALQTGLHAEMLQPYMWQTGR
ncbi:hypothetical protein Bbelb_143420 [Branchiostoma belcheri]|nr:hypothetical protein Bbelb_143420 [Branchiostoma belcheri]